MQTEGLQYIGLSSNFGLPTMMRTYIPPPHLCMSAKLCCKAGILLIAEYTGGVPRYTKTHQNCLLHQVRQCE